MNRTTTRPRLGSLAGYRWPLAPLLEYCRLTASGFARAHGLAATTVCRAAHVGLNDQQADHWALWIGSHPACVWGWPWVEAGLRLDREESSP